MTLKGGGVALREGGHSAAARAGDAGGARRLVAGRHRGAVPGRAAYRDAHARRGAAHLPAMRGGRGRRAVQAVAHPAGHARPSGRLYGRRAAIGRESFRERGCQYVEVTGGAVSLKKKNNATTKK